MTTWEGRHRAAPSWTGVILRNAGGALLVLCILLAVFG